ncbi:hypothetical protein GCM10007116_15550 [Sulfodiicoccus acidiphilus]|uniref:Uncharacterized protein n=2 Tax=Sulfodiicoccus acidiphilus TaxID=1670455 RepID=A0A830H118_9CREN|nr:hypothetical protein GCM10007116_15550 [Sulfodiicoccus acidiphilus]
MLTLYALVGLLGVYSTVYVVPYLTPRSHLSPMIYAHMALGGASAVGSLLFAALSSAIGDRKLLAASILNLGAVGAAGIGGIFFLIERLSFQQFSLQLTFVMLAGFVTAVATIIYSLVHFALRFRVRQLAFPLSLGVFLLILIVGILGISVFPIQSSLEGYPPLLFIHVVLGALAFFTSLGLMFVSTSLNKIFSALSVVSFFGVSVAALGGMLYAALAVPMWPLMLSGFVISMTTALVLVVNTWNLR